MATRKQHFVTFYSPGTMFDERTTRSIDEWDAKKAAKVASGIVERHGAKPYGFQFETRIVADDIDDGSGGKLKVQPKTVETSGMHFLGGHLETVDDVAKRVDPKEDILLRNMRCNGWWVICVTVNGYRSTHRFEADSILCDADGNELDRGDSQKWTAYRAAKDEEERRPDASR